MHASPPLSNKTDAAGKLHWYVRLYHEGKDQRCGPFKDKTQARNFYNKSKTEQLQGRFAVIDSYLATLPHSGKRPTMIADEQYYGGWWKADFKFDCI